MTSGLRHPVLSKITAAVVLTALVAGIPATLLVFFPLVNLPSIEDLASPGEPKVIKTLLLLIVWTCWALFVWAVIVELVGAIRASRTRVRTPFQRLAAYLITTLTLAATSPIATTRVAVPVTAVTATAAPLPEHSLSAAESEIVDDATSYRTYVVKPRDTLWEIARRHLGDPMRYREIIKLNHGRVMSDGEVFSRGDWLRPGWILHLPANATGLDGERKEDVHVHTVRVGESLWEIAEKRLGNGERYRDIFKLNKERAQPHGGRLADPDVLEPGWRLILPVAAPTARKPPSPQHVRPPQTPVSPIKSVTGPAPRATPIVTAPSRVVVLPNGGAVALSFAAGVAVALAAARLRRRREITAPEIDEPVSVLASVPEEPVVQALEQAHRRSCVEPEETPPDDFELVTSSFSNDPPISITVGTRGNDSVSLESCGLHLGLTGPGAEDTIRAVTLDLLAQADRHRVEIVVPRDDAVQWFGEPISLLAEYLPGIRLVPTLEAAVDHLEAQFITRRRILRDSDCEHVSALRDADPGEPLPVLLLVARLPDGGHAYLNTLMELAPPFGIGALLLGHSASGSTCEVDSESRVVTVSGGLAEKLQDAVLCHLSQTAASAILRTLAVGNGMPGEQQPIRKADLPVPPPGDCERHIRFGVVGEPIIEVAGQTVDISRRTKAMELFVLLALHPKGLDREEICAHLWPDLEDPLASYRFHSALKDLRATLREATGLGNKDASFVEVSGKTYRITARHVDVDLWTFHRALADARAAANEQAKLVALEAVAGLCRGVLAQGLRYDWLDQDHRWPLTIASVKALLQLGKLHERAGRNERALEVYDQACALDPDMEAAATAAIRLLLKLGRNDEARQRARHLKSRLEGLGVEPSPETRSTLDQVRAQR